MYAYATSEAGDTAADPVAPDTYAGFPEPVTKAIDQVLAAPHPPYHSPVEEVRIRRGTTVE